MAECSPDRQARVAAIECLHAVILWMIGGSLKTVGRTCDTERVIKCHNCCKVCVGGPWCTVRCSPANATEMLNADDRRSSALRLEGPSVRARYRLYKPIVMRCSRLRHDMKSHTSHRDVASSEFVRLQAQMRSARRGRTRWTTTRAPPSSMRCWAACCRPRCAWLPAPSRSRASCSASSCPSWCTGSRALRARALPACWCCSALWPHASM